MLSSIAAPTGISLVTPASSPGYTDTPVVQVSGVRIGETIKLFTDSACTAQVASGVAAATTINLTSSSLTIGAYNFYANATNSVPASSGCSTATVAYTRVACPAGYTLSSGSCVLSYAGITSVANKTDTSITLNWPTHVAAANYKIYDNNSGTPVLMTTIAAPSTGTGLTGLTPSTTYKFIVRVQDAATIIDINTTEITATMNAAPNVPSGVALVTPATSPGYTDTPVIRVSGVKNGDTIKLFTDSGCTTQVASGAATGSTIDLTTSSLAVGAYTLCFGPQLTRHLV